MGGQKFFENKQGVGNQRLKLKNALNDSRTIINKAIRSIISGTNAPYRCQKRVSRTSLV